MSQIPHQGDLLERDLSKSTLEMTAGPSGKPCRVRLRRVLVKVGIVEIIDMVESPGEPDIGNRSCFEEKRGNE